MSEKINTPLLGHRSAGRMHNTNFLLLVLIALVTANLIVTATLIVGGGVVVSRGQAALSSIEAEAKSAMESAKISLFPADMLLLLNRFLHIDFAMVARNVDQYMDTSEDLSVAIMKRLGQDPANYISQMNNLRSIVQLVADKFPSLDKLPPPETSDTSVLGIVVQTLEQLGSAPVDTSASRATLAASLIDLSARLNATQVVSQNVTLWAHAAPMAFVCEASSFIAVAAHGISPPTTSAVAVAASGVDYCRTCLGKYATCGDCSAGGTGCSWCPARGCVKSDNTGPTKCAIPMAQTCCTDVSPCGACVSSAGCVYCGESMQCTYDDLGTIGCAANAIAGAQFCCDQISNSSSCTTGLTAGHCAWCPTYNQCVYEESLTAESCGV